MQDTASALTDRFAELLDRLPAGLDLDGLVLSMRPAALLRAEPDIEALMQAEGIAMRPGPRPRLDPSLLPTLRRAILEVRLVVMRYGHLGADAPATHVLCPYGTLYGGNGRAWLVGHVEGLPEMRLWRLDRIASMDLLDRSFIRRDHFNLVSYAAKSFGVFQEDPIDVVLRISPEAADDAACWAFHPSQTLERETDGALLVRFHAGGVQEMCWHLFTWGTMVTVVAPDDLRTILTGMLDTAAHHHTRKAPSTDWSAPAARLTNLQHLRSTIRDHDCNTSSASSQHPLTDNGTRNPAPTIQTDHKCPSTTLAQATEPFLPSRSDI
jgi:predicted DNA-binding transcriptional regulator YafY